MPTDTIAVKPSTNEGLLERLLTREMLGVVEAAALSSARWMGKGERDSADDAAVTSMRTMLNQIPFSGIIVIGEGERDEAPMLYIGEKVGTSAINDGATLQVALPDVDIAVDPLEGTNLVANGLPGAAVCLALAPAGGLLHAPDTYMNKLVVGPASVGKIDINAPVAQNLHAVADSLDRPISDITVVILDRPRHETLIQEVRQAGARIRLITDGDMMPAIATALEGSGIHVVMGTGGAPEAVLSAAAVKCLGGEIQAQFRWRSEAEKARAADMGLAGIEEDFVHTIETLAPANQLVFASCGVTTGDLLQGVRYFGSGARTHSILLTYHTGLVRFVDSIHMNRDKPSAIHL